MYSLPALSKLYIAADHAGFALKRALVEHLGVLGYDIVDMGPATFDPDDDYPDFVTPLTKRVVSEPEARGIIVGGSGQGEAMCANRIKGVRAAVFYGEMKVTSALEIEGGNSEDGYDLARLAGGPKDSNVRCTGTDVVFCTEPADAVPFFV